MSNKNIEELNKSIDSLIDELFLEESKVEKSLDIAKDASTTADQAVNKAPSAQNDEARNAGRPKQISDVPNKDQDGKRSSEYDASIAENSKEKDQDEVDQIKEMNQIKEANRAKNTAKDPQIAPFQKSLSEAEFNEYVALKKAKNEVDEKNKGKEQEELIKSIVSSVGKRYEGQIEELTKSLKQQESLIKAMANKPQSAKSITNIEAIEKSFDKPAKTAEFFSKSELLDAAEELFKAGKLRDTHVIELENNGFIYNQEARETLTKYMESK